MPCNMNYNIHSNFMLYTTPQAHALGFQYIYPINSACTPPHWVHETLCNTLVMPCHPYEALIPIWFSIFWQQHHYACIIYAHYWLHFLLEAFFFFRLSPCIHSCWFTSADINCTSDNALCTLLLHRHNILITRLFFCAWDSPFNVPSNAYSCLSFCYLWLEFYPNVNWIKLIHYQYHGVHGNTRNPSLE